MNTPDFLFDIMFGGIFSMAGLGAFVMSICLLRSALRKRRTWKSAAGTVVGYDESTRDRQKYFRPQVQFTADGGNLVIITSNVGSTKHLNRTGEQVKVLYDVNNPDQGVIQSFSALYMPCILFAFFACSFLAVGIHIMCSSTK